MGQRPAEMELASWVPGMVKINNLDENFCKKATTSNLWALIQPEDNENKKTVENTTNKKVLIIIQYLEGVN